MTLSSFVARFATRVLLGACLCLCGCQTHKEAAVQQSLQPSGPLPADLVLCIDNSGSISASEKVLIREIAMLLGDLADVNDRISIVTFGKGARVASSVLIGSDADRETFKQQ